MTVLDQVRKLEQEVIERLKELEPLIREYDELRGLAQRLELDYTPGSTAAARKPTRSRRNTGATRARAKAASPGSSTRNAAAKPRGRRAASKKAPWQHVEPDDIARAWKTAQTWRVLDPDARAPPRRAPAALRDSRTATGVAIAGGG